MSIDYNYLLNKMKALKKFKSSIIGSDSMENPQPTNGNINDVPKGKKNFKKKQQQNKSLT